MVMKLLLTSNGLANEEIAQTLFELVGKKPEDTSIVFVPTASNVEEGDKVWLIDDLMNLKKQHFKSIAIVDIAAVAENIWRPQMEEADVLLFGGGNTYYLMEWMNKCGLAPILPDMLKTKVYAGISAGSMVTAPDLDLKRLKAIYGEEAELDEIKGLGYVDFYFLPHLNSPEFTPRVETTIDEAMKGITRKTYVLDDQSALTVVDGVVEMVGGGTHLEYN